MTISTLDKRLLTQHVLGLCTEEYIMQSPICLSKEQQKQFEGYLKRRAEGEPISKIIGIKPFWKHDFITSTDTLDPRPDSEWLIEAVLKHKPDIATPYSILDCGTGTGCLLLSLLHEYETAQGLGIDQSEAAIAVAKRNATHVGITKRASFQHLDWTKLDDSLYDIIISNPPYIPTHDISSLMPDVRRYDPMKALDGGSDGLDAYKQLLHIVQKRLKKNAIFVCEIGQGQEADVAELGQNAGLIHKDTFKDLAGISRILVFATHNTTSHATD